ncbi:ABC transporter permease [Haloplanus salilacus]|uniref:ABC transporter permease n=1 Tax=Haloplanus salilacus TaxID=2949994 RepID=UPI0030CF7EC1
MGVGHRQREIAGRLPVPRAYANRAGQVLLSVAVSLLGWHVLAVVSGLPTVILPTPLDVAAAIHANAGSMWEHVLYTAGEVVLGWTTGVAAGGLFAFGMAVSPRLRLVAYPYLIAIRILPLVVLVPILILLTGPTLVTRVLIAAILVFFPVTIATLDGLLSVPDNQVALLRSVGTPAWKRLLFVNLPNALPGVFAGLKIATPLAVEGVIIAEFLAASRGIGFRMLQAASNLRTPLLFGYMVVLVALGAVVFGAVLLADRRLQWDDADDVVSDSLWGGGGVGTSWDLSSRALLLGTLPGLIVVWHVTAGIIPHARLFLPTPAAVGAILVSSSHLFVSATVESVVTFANGWTVGAGVGFALGAVAALVPRARAVVYTYLVGFRVMPVIAFAPVLLVWLGVSVEAAVVLVAAATFFPVAMGAATGLARLPPAHADLFALVNAPAWRIFLVRLRYATPALFSGLKLSIITGISGVVVAEWFVSNAGLGVLVLQQTRTFQPDLAFAAIVWLFALGAGTFAAVSALQRRLTW